MVRECAAVTPSPKTRVASRRMCFMKVFIDQ
jgi:hypothetical protein